MVLCEVEVFAQPDTIDSKLAEAYVESLLIGESASTSISLVDMNNDGRSDLLLSGIYLNAGFGQYSSMVGELKQPIFFISVCCMFTESCESGN